MSILVWIGVAITVAGLCGIVWCGIGAARARASELDDEALRKHLGRLVPVNLAALGVSGIGLMCVIIGLILT